MASSDAALRAPMSPRRLLIATSLLLAMGIAWGGSFSLGRIAVVNGAHPFSIAFWEGVGSGLLLFAVMGLRHQKLPLDRRALIFYSISGLLGVSFPASLIFFSARHLPAGLLAMAVTIVPILTYAIAMSIGVERFSKLRSLGLLIGFCGIGLVLIPRSSLPDPSLTSWMILAFAAAACYGAQNVYVARCTPAGMSSLALSAGTLLGGGVQLLPLFLLDNKFLAPWPPLDVTHAAVGAMTVINAVGSWVFLRMIHSAGPVFTSQTAYCVTIFGMIWGMVLFGERHSLWIWAALGLLIAGVILVGFRQTRAH